MFKSFLLFGAAGMLGEVVFTALRKRTWDLTGYTHLWMLFIYGLGALFYPCVLPLAQNFHWVIRGAIYGTIIMAVEYVAGWILDQTTGSCPWDYWYDWDINAPLPKWYQMQYIRLDYFPIWAVVGLIGEAIYYAIT